MELDRVSVYHGSDQVYNQIFLNQVSDQVWDQVSDQVCSQVKDQVCSQVRDQVWNGLEDLIQCL